MSRAVGTFSGHHDQVLPAGESAQAAPRRIASPRPAEADVRITLSLGGMVFAFAACRTAAETFLRDLDRRCIADWAVVAERNTANLPRLPAERLYLGS